MKHAIALTPKGNSNEKVMGGLFFVLVLYQLPLWLKDLQVFLHFLILTAIGLVLDTVINLIRHKKPVCAVSAAITAGVVTTLLYQVALPWKILGLLVAILPGKHLWGGTGKNIINPALAGVFVVCLFQPVNLPLFPMSLLFLPAVIASVLFLRIRLQAGLAYMAGAVLSLVINGDFSWEKLITFGIIFFGTVVITDPVTITFKPLYGAVLGFAAGLIPYLISADLFRVCALILLANLLSYLLEDIRKEVRYYRPVRIEKRIRMEGQPIGIEQGELPAGSISDISSEEILNRIRRHQVFGMGGAAFPTDTKIQSVMESDASEKHLILNGVECDPGLIHDQWLLEHCMGEIEQGVEVLKKLIPFQTVTLAVKGSDKSLTGRIRRVFKADGHGSTSLDTKLEIHPVSDFFPAGFERVLIREVLRKELNTGDIPAKMGILVLNVQTVIAIYRAVVLDEDITTRVITVADLKKRIGCVMKVRIGEKVSEAIHRVFPNAIVFFTGGGLMQGTLADDDTVITPEVNFIATGDIPGYKESVQCSHCGMCIMHCPAYIDVRKVADLVDAGKKEEAKAFHAEKCIQCGVCSYLCPAGRKLSQRVQAVMMDKQ